MVLVKTANQAVVLVLVVEGLDQVAVDLDQVVEALESRMKRMAMILGEVVVVLVATGLEALAAVEVVDLAAIEVVVLENHSMMTTTMTVAVEAALVAIGEVVCKTCL